MKYSVLLLVFLLVLECRSQRIGLFISTQDFRKNTAFTCPSDVHLPKVKLHILPFRNYVTVICKDSVYRFSKDSIFGYRDIEDNYFRFYKKETYSILNRKETILLYRKETVSRDPKDMRSYEAYYFSKDEQSPLHELRICNLLKVFASNRNFTDLIETHFKSDAELLDPDIEHKEYKLNRLFELSTKK